MWRARTSRLRCSISWNGNDPPPGAGQHQPLHPPRMRDRQLPDHVRLLRPAKPALVIAQQVRRPWVAAVEDVGPGLQGPARVRLAAGRNVREARRDDRDHWQATDRGPAIEAPHMAVHDWADGHCARWRQRPRRARLLLARAHVSARTKFGPGGVGGGRCTRSLVAVGDRRLLGGALDVAPAPHTAFSARPGARSCPHVRVPPRRLGELGDELCLQYFLGFRFWASPSPSSLQGPSFSRPPFSRGPSPRS